MEKIISLVADGLVIPVVLLGGYLLLFRLKDENNRYQVYVRILMAGLTAFLVAKIVAVLFQPNELRPFEALGLAPKASFLNNPGFPSDHALFVVAIFWATVFESRSKIGIALVGILSVMVCIGRVLALVHTPLDVIGGVLVATVGIIWYLWPSKKNRKKA